MIWEITAGLLATATKTPNQGRAGKPRTLDEEGSEPQAHRASCIPSHSCPWQPWGWQESRAGFSLLARHS